MSAPAGAADQRPDAPLISVHRLKLKCPVCGKRDNCAVSADGRRAFCRRVMSDKPGRGGWTHLLTDAALPVSKLAHARVSASVERAAIDQRDAIYCTLLRKRLKLADEHRRKLRARGLSGHELARNGYASTPDTRCMAEVATQLSTYGLEGVPGFYRGGDAWRMVRTRAGYFVPYRDARGRIQAMQYRLDEPLAGKTKYLWFSSRECSSGAPTHHANHHLLAAAEELTITEGALKADVIAYLTQAPVVGIAGVSTFSRDFAIRLRASAPRLRRALVAYDRDLLDKPEVFGALMRLTEQLEAAGLCVRIRTWPAPWKGLDDYLLAQLNPAEACVA